MKKTIVIIIILVVVIGIFGLLFRNKAANQAKIKENINLSIIPVSVTQTQKMKIDDTLSIVGTTYGNTEVSVLSETTGRVVELYADLGSRLSKGSPILKVDDEIKQANLINAEANYQKTKTDLDRYKKLLEEKSVNEAQVEQAQLAFKIAESQYIIAKRQLADTKIISPSSGVVTTKNIEIGSVLGVNTPVVTIVDISTLKLKVSLSEKDVFKLKVGDMVDITTNVYPGARLKGRVKNINDKADETHGYAVEITIQNSREYPLRAGMFARVYFNSIKKGESLVIPRDALVGSTRNPQVYIVDNGLAKLRNLQIGEEIGNLLEIVSGLNGGETIVTNGQINLRDNTPVSIIK